MLLLRHLVLLKRELIPSSKLRKELFVTSTFVFTGSLSLNSYVICEAPGSTGLKICFLTLAEKGYPRRFAFDYLDDIQKEFLQLHGQQIDSVERPYKFISFGLYA